MYAKLGDEVFYYENKRVLPRMGEVAEIKNGVITKVTVTRLAPPDGSGIPIYNTKVIDTTMMVVKLVSTFYPLLRKLFLDIFGNREDRLKRKAERKYLKSYRKALKENRVLWYKADFYEKHKNKPVTITKNGALKYVGVSKDNYHTLLAMIDYNLSLGGKIVVRRIGDFVYTEKVI